MQRLSFKTVQSLAILIIGLLAFSACQKEGILPKDPTQTATAASERSPEHYTYAVTVFSPGNPSVIVEIEEATGNVTNFFPAFVLDNNNAQIPVEDLKGICRTSWGQFFITTGDQNSTPLYNNTLLKVNVNLPFAPLGQCSFFNSICPTGPVSDLEFNPITQTFFGLQNNSNRILEITLDPNGNYTVYSAPAAILGIQGRTLSGLSLVRDGSPASPYFVGAASRPLNGAVSAQLYQVPANGGLAALMTDLNPLPTFAGGHCGIGFDIQLNHLAINHTNVIPFVAAGLSEVNPWVAPPLPPVTPTNVWTTADFIFEDLSTYLGG